MEQKTSYAIPVGIPIVLLVLLLFVGLLYFQKSSSTTLPSTFSLSPTPSSETGTEVEEVVTSWKPYENIAYTFNLQVPADWKSQDYSQFYAQGGTVIAFSPNSLPCSTCTYVHDGFMSVHIYNEKTDPLSFTTYQQHLKQAESGKEVARVNIGANTGIMAANSVALEHGGWVYEFVLDTHDGNDVATSSKIFQRIVTSLQFTDLKFAP